MAVKRIWWNAWSYLLPVTRYMHFVQKTPLLYSTERIATLSTEKSITIFNFHNKKERERSSERQREIQKKCGTSKVECETQTRKTFMFIWAENWLQACGLLSLKFIPLQQQFEFESPFLNENGKRDDTDEDDEVEWGEIERGNMGSLFSIVHMCSSVGFIGFLP